MKKILYISDSLGTPIHPRGIYYYSLALVNILSSLNFDISLLVEKVDGFGIPDFVENDKVLGKSFSESSVASEVYRYFLQREFSAQLELRNLEENNTLKVKTKQKSLYEGGYNFSLSQNSKNKFDHLGFKRNFFFGNNFNKGKDVLKHKGNHLKLFSSFIFSDYIYSDSMAYAVNELPPPSIDASEFDLVFIDTPHYIKVEGIDSTKIFSVVHDLIPVRDFSTNAEWRLMFLQKLKASLAHNPNMIFVSEFTKKQFYEEIPNIKIRKDIIVYPTIRNETISNSNKPLPGEESNYSKWLSEMKPRYLEDDLYNNMRKNDPSLKKDSEVFISALNSIEKWDPSLPYFCTALSDEPRKNIKILVEVSRKFIGKANIIVMGKVNGNYHMGMHPEKFPNLHFTGYVSDQQKDEIFKHSIAVIFPSFAEGFGIPLVEGALYRVPVLCSKISVFEEIAKKYAIYFDPYNVSSLENAMNTLLKSPNEYRDAAEKLYPTLIERFSQNTMKNTVKTAVEEV